MSCDTRNFTPKLRLYCLLWFSSVGRILDATEHTRVIYSCIFVTELQKTTHSVKIHLHFGRRSPVPESVLLSSGRTLTHTSLQSSNIYKEEKSVNKNF